MPNMASVRSGAVLGLFLCCIVSFVQYSNQGGVRIEFNPDVVHECYSCEGGGSQPLAGEGVPTVPQDALVDKRQYLVLCRKSAMAVVLPPGPLSEVKVFGITPVQEDVKTCGYSLSSRRGKNIVHISYTCCKAPVQRIGNTMIYLAQVQAPIKMRNFKYGIITRDHPVRVMIECRYSEIGPNPTTGWTTAGYMVMSTNLPALVRAKGLFGVQLRIAEDETFSTFLSHDHQPLRVLLGKPVYLEVRLISPNPEATLLVHYCLAYPRSARNAMVLLYEGCPNPLDSDNISILHMADLPQNRFQRRFEVKAFQFMDQSTNRYLSEEIYFMCSTEVCMPSETPCKETCFDVKSS